MTCKKSTDNLKLIISLSRICFGGLMILVILMFSGCWSVQLNSGTVSTGDTIDMTNTSSMNKDAIRVVGKVEQVNGVAGEQSSFGIVIKKIEKYGATFSSIEPKVGDMVIMSAPADVSISKGQVILVDILTPRIDQGERPLKVRMG